MRFQSDKRRRIQAGCEQAVTNFHHGLLGEDELYVAVPGKDLATIADEVETIAAANAKLSEYHRGRRQGLATE